MASNSFKVKNSLVLTPKDLSTLTSPEPGDLACDINDNNKIKRYDQERADWVEVGSGGGGGLDVFYSENVDDLPNVTSFDKGNNASFMGGGTMAGTFSFEEINPISGLKSLKYIQAASGSLNDYFASDFIDIDPKQQGKTCGLTLYFNYDGNNGDGRFVVFDATNNQIISDQLALVENTGGQASRYSLSFTVPPSCNQIRWGYQVLVQNSGADLLVDDVEMTTDPFVEANLDNMTDWKPYSPSTSSLGGTTSVLFKYRRVGDSMEIQGRFILTSTGSSGNVLISIPSGFNIDTNKRTGTLVGISSFYDSSAGQEIVAQTTNLSGNDLSLLLNEKGGSVLQGNQTGVNDYIRINATVPIVGWSSSTESILTPSDTFSTDTAPLAYAPSTQYTLSTLENAPVGTFITFTYAANTNTRTQTTTAPTQSTADMNQNGIRMFARAYNASSTAANPAAVAIQIGKGLKGWSLKGYSSTNKSGDQLQADIFQSGSFTFGFRYKSYSELTGILILDAGVNLSSSTGAFFETAGLSSVPNGYWTINAGKTLPLLAIPTPLVGYLKDVKPSGAAAGGTFTSGAWQTRTLNTVEGDFNKFGTLSGNQFTLQPGTYEIEASAPAGFVNRHKAKLRNITDSTDAIIGSSERSAVFGETPTRSEIIGTLNLNSSKTFEIQHQAQSTVANFGFGTESSFGVSEVYTICKITKLS